MLLNSDDWTALVLTLKLAFFSTVLLLFVGTFLAFLLSRIHSWWKVPLESIISLPLVLPPTVMGFYLLVFMGPDGFLGKIIASLNIAPLTFSFEGLVFASVIYSLPFVVRPIQQAIENLGPRPFEVAASLRSGPVDSFFRVMIPQIKGGLLTAMILGFAHTLGEFGIILMIGGSIPGETKVISIQIYEQVETLNFDRAQALSLFMIVFSYGCVFLMHLINRSKRLGL